MLCLALAACSGPKRAAKPAAPAPPTPPAEPPAPPKPPPPLTADDVPPRKAAEGDGIHVAEAADGRVVLKTTAIWNEEINTVYDDCEYYRKALPVLRRQVSPERAKVLDGVCVPEKAKPKAKGSKAKAQGGGAQAPKSG